MSLLWISLRVLTRDTSLDEISMSLLWISLRVLTHSLDLTLNKVNSFLASGPMVQEMKVHWVSPQLSSDRNSVSASLIVLSAVDIFLLSPVSILLLCRRVLYK